MENTNRYKLPNGKWGMLGFVSSKVETVLLEMEDGGNSWKQSSARGEASKDCPVLAKGFTAFALNCLNSNDSALSRFNSYMKASWDKFNSIEKVKPDAPFRKLESEFISIHNSKERELAEYSKIVFDYLEPQEAELLKSYAASYLTYVKVKSQEMGKSMKMMSVFSDACLIDIKKFLIEKKQLSDVSDNMWLYWFGRITVASPMALQWLGSPTMLSNVTYQICGCHDAKSKEAIMKAFCVKEILNSDYKKYTGSEVFNGIKSRIEKYPKI